MPDRRLISTAHGTHSGAFESRDWGLLAAITAMWGSSYLFIEIAVEDLSPSVVTASRLFIGAAVLALFSPARAKIDRQDWAHVALLGAVWLVVPLTLFPIAEQWVSSALTGMLAGSSALFAALVAAVLLRQLPGGVQIAGLALGFIGVAVVSIPALINDEGSSTTIGVILILIAFFCEGLALALSVPLTQRYGGPPVMLRMLLVAAVITFPFGVAGAASSHFTPEAVASVVILGLGATATAFVLMGKLAGRVGATRASVTIYLIAAVAVLLGIEVLHEPVAALSLVGLVFVLCGAWLVGRAEQRADR